MFTITLYNFTKKTNSTKQPTGTGTDFSCDIKTMSSLMSPVVELASGTSLVGFNYAYISEFNRYYFINDVTWNAGLWILSLKCDVLATYKSDIGDTTMYMLRASSNTDGYIQDNYWQMRCNSSLSKIAIKENYASNFGNGYFVLNVLGDGNVPGIDSFQMTPAQFRSFINALYATANGYAWGDFTQGAINSLFNPEEKIVSCYWFPESFHTSGTANICLGLWSSGVTAGKIDVGQYFSGTSVTVPKHPKASSYGQYCNLAPYTEHTVSVGMGNTVKIDASKLIGVTNAVVAWFLDPFTGQAIIRGQTADVGVTTQELFRMTVPWGVAINLAVGKNNMEGLLTSVISSVAGMMTGEPLTALGSALGLGSSFINSLTGSVSNATSQAGVIHHQQGIYWHSRFFDIAARDVANFGAPCCKNLKPSAINGYMVAGKGDIDIPNATGAEREAISGFLTTGFYYE